MIFWHRFLRGLVLLIWALLLSILIMKFFFSCRRRHTRWPRDWSSDVCSSDLCRHAGILPRAGLFKQLLQRRTLLCTVLVLARFPQNLTEDAQSEFGVSIGKPEAVDKATDLDRKSVV